MNNITAKVSAFARAYHHKIHAGQIFDDEVAYDILTKEEYDEVARHMKNGISFFAPDFSGTSDEALDFVVTHQLAPTPLARASFAERALENAAKCAVKQYILLGAGYDSFALRKPSWAENMTIFEVDKEEIICDKQKRVSRFMKSLPENVYYIKADLCQKNWQSGLLNSSAYQADARSFVSLLGLVYYLPQTAFRTLLGTLNDLLPSKSTIVFDYPDFDVGKDENGVDGKQVKLAAKAQESMENGYEYHVLEKMLEENNFLIYEYVSPAEIQRQFFDAYNEQNPTHQMNAVPHTNFCLAVKQ